MPRLQVSERWTAQGNAGTGSGLRGHFQQEGSIFSSGKETNEVNDLETLKSMLERAKIPFKQHDSGNKIELVVENGYFGFYTCFTFAPQGVLTQVGAYED